MQTEGEVMLVSKCWNKSFVLNHGFHCVLTRIRQLRESSCVMGTKKGKAKVALQ